MSTIDRWFSKIPALLSSQVSVFIFFFLFIYLFILGFIGLFWPAVKPSSDAQLVFGNYTNVLSALGAALAAGASTKHNQNLKKLHARHEQLQASIEDLHRKVDKLSQ
jgi:hypothetical protein